MPPRLIASASVRSAAPGSARKLSPRADGWRDVKSAGIELGRASSSGGSGRTVPVSRNPHHCTGAVHRFSNRSRTISPGFPTSTGALAVAVVAPPDRERPLRRPRACRNRERSVGRAPFEREPESRVVRHPRVHLEHLPRRHDHAPIRGRSFDHRRLQPSVDQRRTEPGEVELDRHPRFALARNAGDGQEQPCAQRQANDISETSGATVSGAAVAARTSSTRRPGASSLNTNPSGPTWTYARSVTTSFTQPRAVAG